MARSPIPVTHFSAGELSERMLGRIDLSRYYAGARQLKNVFLQPQGGVFKRPGTEFLANESTTKLGGYDFTTGEERADHRLFPFEFSSEDAYVIEISRLGYRFYRNGGLIVADACTPLAGGFFTTALGVDWIDSSSGTGSVAIDTANGQLTMTMSGSTGYAQLSCQETVAGADQGAAHVLSITIRDGLLSNLSPSGRGGVLGAAYIPEGATNDPTVQLMIGNAGVASAQYADVFLPAGFHTVPFTPTTGQLDITLKFLHPAAAFGYEMLVDLCQMCGASSGTTKRADGIFPVEMNMFGRTLVPLVSEDNLMASQTMQSADALYWVMPRHPLRKFIRYGHSEWSLEEPQLIGPFGDPNVTSTTLTPASAANEFVLNASSANGINGNAGFTAHDVGRYVKMVHGSTVSVAIIFSINSTTSVDARYIDGHANLTTSAADQWTLGVWRKDTSHLVQDGVQGPLAMTFHQQRMLLAGYDSHPQTIFASETGLFESFVTGTAADDAWTYQIGSGQFNHIRWLSGITDLLVGTGAGEFRVSVGNNEVITPTNAPDIVPQTSYGSALVQPLQIANAILFVQRTGRKVRESSYQFDRDAYVAPDITVLSEHLTNTYQGENATGRIRQLAYMREPIPMVFAVVDDGRMLCLTYEREQDVVGWTEYTPAHTGTLSDGGPNSRVKSVCVLPSASGGGYDLYLAVARATATTGDPASMTVDTYIERMIVRRDNDSEADGEHPWFVDAGVELVPSGTPATSLATPDIYNGKVVSVLADGDPHLPLTPAAGAATLNYAASKVVIGFGYDPVVETMPINPQEIMAMHNQKGIGRIAVLLNKSLAVLVNGEQVPDREVADTGGFVSADEHQARLTGFFYVSDEGYDEAKSVTISQPANMPVALNVLGVFINAEVSSE